MKIILLPVSVLLVAACASSGPQSQIGTQEKADRRIQMTRTTDCVFQSSISGFEALDNRYVVLFSMGRRKAYLAEITGGCFDMKSQTALVPVDGDGNGQICGFGRDSVAFRRLGAVEDCRIMALQELSDERRVELGVGAPPPKPKKEKKPEDEDEESK